MKQSDGDDERRISAARRAGNETLVAIAGPANEVASDLTMWLGVTPIPVNSNALQGGR